MNRLGKSWAILGMLVIGTASAQNASIPTLDEEPGQSMLRAPDASYGIEIIDPFTGALKIVATDLLVPATGGSTSRSRAITSR